MSDYILDTNILSELAKPRPDPSVVQFLESAPNLRVSVMVFDELAYGLSIAPEHHKKRLTVFIDEMHAIFAIDAVPVDLNIAKTAGRLRGFSKQQGRILHYADAIMAATAMNNGSILLTRNTKDFTFLSVGLLNPFSTSAE